MKRISVLLVLVLTLFSLAALTSCGCQASSDAKPSGQTSTPGSNTNNGTTNNGTANNGSTGNGTTNNGTNSGVTTPAPGNSSLTDDIIDGGENIVDGVIEGGQDIVDGVGDAITGNNGTGSNLPTYEDMVRNGRIR